MARSRSSKAVAASSTTVPSTLDIELYAMRQELETVRAEVAEHKTKAKEMEVEIDESRREIADQKDRIKDLEWERECAEDRHDTESWLREQMDTLAIDVDTSSAPATHDQWRRCLKGIAGGTDWRYGTWR